VLTILTLWLFPTRTAFPCRAGISINPEFMVSAAWLSLF